MTHTEIAAYVERVRASGASPGASLAAVWAFTRDGRVRATVADVAVAFGWARRREQEVIADWFKCRVAVVDPLGNIAFPSADSTHFQVRKRRSAALPHYRTTALPRLPDGRVPTTARTPEQAPAPAHPPMSRRDKEGDQRTEINETIRGDQDNRGATNNRPEQVREVATRLIARLNALTGKSYSPTAKSTLKFIGGRLAEGRTEALMLAVVEDQCKRRLGTEWEWCLRPETLFNETKFEGYQGQLGNGKPAAVALREQDEDARRARARAYNDELERRRMAELGAQEGRA